MKRLNVFSTVLLIFVLVVTIFYGCQPAPKAEAPKKEKVTVRLVNLGDATGPYAVTIGPQLDGAKDFAEWANKTDYLPGVILDIRTYDHGLNMENCVALYKEAVNSTPAPVLTNGGLWSTAAPVLAGFAKQNKIPIIDATSIKEVIVPPGWFFGYQPSYEGQVGAFVDWIVKHWKADSEVPWIRKHYQNRKPRLALMSWDIALGRANESKESKCYAESKGVEYVGVEYVPLQVGDVTPQLSRLKDKVDFIYIGMFASAWQAVLKQANQLGMRDQFMDFGPSYFSPLEIAKFVPDLANNNGNLGIFILNFDEMPPYVQEAHLKRGYPKEFMSYMVGWYWADLATQAVRKTIERVGVDKITGQAIYDTLCAGAITKFKPMNSSNTITWSNNSKLVKMDGGDSVYLSCIQGWDGKSTDALH